MRSIASFAFLSSLVAGSAVLGSPDTINLDPAIQHLSNIKNVAKSFASRVFVDSADARSQAIIDLEPQNFGSLINSHDLVLTEFYAPWCKVCQEVEPIVEEAAKVLKNKNITAARVDCDAHKELCERYYIGIFPTFMVFKGLNNKRAYNGPREVEEFVSYMEKHTLPAASIVDNSNFESFKDSDSVAVLGLFDENDQDSQEFFGSLANTLRDEFTFGISTDKELAENERQQQPSIILYKKFDDGKSVYTGPLNKDDVANFISKTSIPWIDEFSLQTSQRYFKHGLPLAFLVHDEPQQRERLVEELRPIAKDHEDSLRFVTLGYSAKILSKLRFNVEKFPALLLINSDNKRYAMSPHHDVNETTVGAFLQDFKNNKVQEYFRSEPIPQQQDGPVTVVVRDNFEKVVLDDNKDVLVEFYAPWCGHCKAFAPDYEELATRYASLKNKVIIAKLDATANDIPDQTISSYPTIMLFKAGDKQNPVKFEGERSISALAKFIGENGTRKMAKAKVHDEL